MCIVANRLYMSNTKINSIADFYTYIDTNVESHVDTVNLKIDISNLSEKDKKQIQLIIDCLNYIIQCGKLKPLITYDNGQSYPNILSLNSEDILCLTNYINTSNNLYIKTHINHFLFIRAKCKNKIVYAQKAINLYFELLSLKMSHEDTFIESDKIYNNLT